jgi:hypothetical protein
MIGVTVLAENLEEAEAFVGRMDAALQPQGKAVEAGLSFLLREGLWFAGENTHIWTDTLNRSYLTEQRENIGVIYIDPGAVNPYGQRPAEYAAYEFGRGGDHDAFTLTQEFIEAELIQEAGVIMIEAAATA